ncbi:hypothetical protein [Vibrio algarum]|uniref:Lipoprotein n=1 Tax=Vibrio algarum TaxID=3020714 RepID=A0ABT4YNY9_9VIBR|nr:hypothetical protein [Vibrio sp. KJ40-1]MDB1123267.1 hypothetical protein [Vibrio sp. KJ40-1]
MKFLKIFVSLIFVLVLAGCGRVQPIMDVENTPVAYDLQKKQVKMAIIDSAVSRGWVVKKAESNEVELEFMARTHKATIRVPYSEKFFSILYVSSENLKADAKGNIHRNYNRWVNNLNVDIQKKISVIANSN